jgi:hypothetical protein
MEEIQNPYHSNDFAKVNILNELFISLRYLFSKTQS